MNNYMVTLTNGDGDYYKVFVMASDGNKAALIAEDEYNRRGWHLSRCRQLIIGSEE